MKEQEPKSQEHKSELEDNEQSIPNEQIEHIKEEFKHDFESGLIHKTEYFDLFISYKRDHGHDNGQVLAERLYDELTADGFKVWLDKQEIGFSGDYEKRIETALLHSKKVACVIGPEWAKSKNCIFEARKAVEFEKRIIPIRYQSFRKELREQVEHEKLTEREWRRIDKPQSVDFGDNTDYQRAYHDLKAVIQMSAVHYNQHIKVLTEAFYWNIAGQPKSMLLKANDLNQAKLLKSRFDRDEDLPSFALVQNEFLEASEAFVNSEVTNRRMVYVAYPPNKYDYAAELDIELKLHGITTWFDDLDADKERPKPLASDLLKCDNILCIYSGKSSEENELEETYAKENNKRLIRITDTVTTKKKLAAEGIENVLVWSDQLNIDFLIQYIRRDREYNDVHGRLLASSSKWIDAGKSNSNLLPLREAEEMKTWYQLAEQNQSEPAPNLDMINYVERSIVWGETLKRRRILTYWTGIIGGVVLAILAIAAVLLWRLAQEEKDEAAIAKREADALKTEAEQLMMQNEKAKLELQEVQKEVERANENAKRQTIAAKVAHESAKLAELEARKRTEEARLNRIAAEKAYLEAYEASQKASLALREADSSSFRSEISGVQNKVLDYLNESDKQADAARKNFNGGNREAAILSLDKALNSLDGSNAYFQQISQLLPAKYDTQPARLNIVNEMLAELETHLRSDQTNKLYQIYHDLLSDRNSLSAQFKLEPSDEKEVFSKMPQAYASKHAQNQFSVFKAGNSQMKVSSFESLSKYNSYMEAFFNHQKYLEHLTSSPDVLSAVGIAKDFKFIALGYENGIVKIINEKGKVTEQMSQHGSKPITSLVFNSMTNQLAVSTLEREISFVDLDGRGKIQNKTEIIILKTVAPIDRLYFTNDNILMAQYQMHYNGQVQYAAWCTKVSLLHEFWKADESITQSTN